MAVRERPSQSVHNASRRGCIPQRGLAATSSPSSTPIEAIYASTLVSTQQTAAPLAAAHGLDVRVRAGLREVSAGELEMRFDDVARGNVPNESTVVLDGHPGNGWHAMTWDGIAVP